MSREGSDFDALTGASPTTAAGGPTSQVPAEHRDRRRLIAAGIFGAVIAVFAVVNLNEVKVHWVVATARTPLIVVIAFAFFLGMIVDRLAIRARRKRRR